MLATCWLFSIVIQKKKKKKKDKMYQLILQSLHFYFLQRLSDNVAIISLVGWKIDRSISIIILCKLLFGSISARRERKIVEEGDVRYSTRWTFRDIPGCSDEKIGEVSDSRRDSFFLDPKCTCTDFPNIHTYVKFIFGVTAERIILLVVYCISFHSSTDSTYSPK